MYHFDQVGSIAEVHQLWLQLVDCCLRPRCSLQGRKRLGWRGRLVPRTFREGLVQNAKCTRRATRHRHRLAGKRAALDVDACCWCGRRCTTNTAEVHIAQKQESLCLQSGSYGDAEQCRDADAHYRRAGDALFTLIEVKQNSRGTQARAKARDVNRCQPDLFNCERVKKS